MRIATLLASVGLALLALGCGKSSPNIEFVKQPFFNATEKPPRVTHYVRVYRPVPGGAASSGSGPARVPVPRLGGANFKVRVGSETKQPSVTPSSMYTSRQFAASILLDKSGPKDAKWTQMRRALGAILRKTALSKFALTVVNGDQPAPILKNKYGLPTQIETEGLAPSGQPPQMTLQGIAQATAVDRASLGAQAKTVVIAVVRSGAAQTRESVPSRWPSGTPVIVLNFGSDDPTLRRIADDSGGAYIHATLGDGLGAGSRAVDEAAKSLADQYAITFPVSDTGAPPAYTVIVSHDGVTDEAEYVPDIWVVQFIVIVVVVMALVAVALLAVRRARKPGLPPVAPAPYGSPSDDTVGNTTTGDYAGDAGGAMGASMGNATVGESAVAGNATVGESPRGAGPDIGGDTTLGQGGYVQGNPWASRMGDATTGENDSAPPFFAAGFASAVEAAYVVRVANGAAQGREARFNSTASVGRAERFEETSTQLGLPGDPRVSRLHARFVFTPDGRLRIEHLSGTNKTYVNESPVDAARNVGAGDRIRMGDTILEIVSVQSGGATSQ